MWGCTSSTLIDFLVLEDPKLPLVNFWVVLTLIHFCICLCKDPHHHHSLTFFPWNSKKKIGLSFLNSWSPVECLTLDYRHLAIDWLLLGTAICLITIVGVVSPVTFRLQYIVHCKLTWNNYLRLQYYYCDEPEEVYLEMSNHLNQHEV